MKTIGFSKLLKRDAERVLSSVPTETAKKMTERLSLHPECAALAYVLGKPVGIVCSGMSDSNRRASVFLFVLPEYRRRGFGSELLNHTVRSAFSLGVCQIYLEFDAKDTDLIAFARKNGFEYGFSSQYMKYDGKTPEFSDDFEKYDDSLYSEYQRLEAEAFYDLRKSIGNEPAMMLPSENLRSFMRRNAENIFVIREKGKIIAGLNVDDDLIEDVFVCSEHRGKGLGRLLICKGISVVRQKKERPAFLWVVCENKSAVNLYDSMGFTVEKKHLFFRKNKGQSKIE